MRKSIFVPTLFSFLCLFLLAACNGKKDKQHPVLAVTIEPLRYLTEQIAGKDFEVITLVPNGNSPETYEPTPSQIAHLQRSAAFFALGHLGFEAQWIEKFAELYPKMPVCKTDEGLSLIKEASSHESHAQGVDPHVWFSPRNMLQMADSISQTLCRLFPQKESVFKANTLHLQADIKATDDTIRNLLKNRSVAFVCYHPTLTYFAREYNCIQIPIEAHGKEPSARALQQLIQQARAHHVKVVLVEKEFDLRYATVIAQELGAQAIQINTLSYQWRKEILRTAYELKKHSTDK